jgi:hypothetical protein
MALYPEGKSLPHSYMSHLEERNATSRVIRKFFMIVKLKRGDGMGFFTLVYISNLLIWRTDDWCCHYLAFQCNHELVPKYQCKYFPVHTLYLEKQLQILLIVLYPLIQHNLLSPEWTKWLMKSYIHPLPNLVCEQ